MAFEEDEKGYSIIPKDLNDQLKSWMYYFEEYFPNTKILPKEKEYTTSFLNHLIEFQNKIKEKFEINELSFSQFDFDNLGQWEESEIKHFYVMLDFDFLYKKDAIDTVKFQYILNRNLLTLTIRTEEDGSWYFKLWECIEFKNEKENTEYIDRGFQFLSEFIEIRTEVKFKELIKKYENNDKNEKSMMEKLTKLMELIKTTTIKVEKSKIFKEIIEILDIISKTTIINLKEFEKLNPLFEFLKEEFKKDLEYDQINNIGTLLKYLIGDSSSISFEDILNAKAILIETEYDKKEPFEIIKDNQIYCKFISDLRQVKKVYRKYSDMDDEQYIDDFFPMIYWNFKENKPYLIYHEKEQIIIEEWKGKAKKDDEKETKNGFEKIQPLFDFLYNKKQYYQELHDEDVNEVKTLVYFLVGDDSKRIKELLEAKGLLIETDSLISIIKDSPHIYCTIIKDLRKVKQKYREYSDMDDSIDTEKDYYNAEDHIFEMIYWNFKEQKPHKIYHKLDEKIHIEEWKDLRETEEEKIERLFLTSLEKINYLKQDDLNPLEVIILPDRPTKEFKRDFILKLKTEDYLVREEYEGRISFELYHLDKDKENLYFFSIDNDYVGTDHIDDKDDHNGYLINAYVHNFSLFKEEHSLLYNSLIDKLKEENLELKKDKKLKYIDGFILEVTFEDLISHNPLPKFFLTTPIWVKRENPILKKVDIFLIHLLIIYQEKKKEKEIQKKEGFLTKDDFKKTICGNFIMIEQKVPYFEFIGLDGIDMNKENYFFDFYSEKFKKEIKEFKDREFGNWKYVDEKTALDFLKNLPNSYYTNEVSFDEDDSYSEYDHIDDGWEGYVDESLPLPIYAFVFSTKNKKKFKFNIFEWNKGIKSLPKNIDLESYEFIINSKDCIGKNKETPDIRDANNLDEVNTYLNWSNFSECSECKTPELTTVDGYLIGKQIEKKRSIDYFNVIFFTWIRQKIYDAKALMKKMISDPAFTHNKKPLTKKNFDSFVEHYKSENYLDNTFAVLIDNINGKSATVELVQKELNKYFLNVFVERGEEALLDSTFKHSGFGFRIYTSENIYDEIVIKQLEKQRYIEEVEVWYEKNKDFLNAYSKTYKKVKNYQILFDWIYFVSYGSDDNTYFIDHIQDHFSDDFSEEEIDKLESWGLYDSIESVIEKIGIVNFLIKTLNLWDSNPLDNHQFDHFPKNHFKCEWGDYDGELSCELNLREFKIEIYKFPKEFPNIPKEMIFTSDPAIDFDNIKIEVCNILNPNKKESFYCEETKEEIKVGDWVIIETQEQLAIIVGIRQIKNKTEILILTDDEDIWYYFETANQNEILGTDTYKETTKQRLGSQVFELLPLIKDLWENGKSKDDLHRRFLVDLEYRNLESLDDLIHWFHKYPHRLGGNMGIQITHDFKRKKLKDGLEYLYFEDTGFVKKDKVINALKEYYSNFDEIIGIHDLSKNQYSIFLREDAEEIKDKKEYELQKQKEDAEKKDDILRIKESDNNLEKMQKTTEVLIRSIYEDETDKKALYKGEETKAYKEWKQKRDLYEAYNKESGKIAVRGGKETKIYQKWKEKYLNSKKVLTKDDYDKILKNNMIIIKQTIPCYEIDGLGSYGTDSDKELYYFEKITPLLIEKIDEFKDRKFENWKYFTNDTALEVIENLPSFTYINDDESHFKTSDAREEFTQLTEGWENFIDENEPIPIYAFIYRDFKKKEKMKFKVFEWKEESYDINQLPEDKKEDLNEYEFIIDYKNCIGINGEDPIVLTTASDLEDINRFFNWSVFSESPKCKKPELYTIDGKKYLGTQVLKEKLVDTYKIIYFTWLKQKIYDITELYSKIKKNQTFTNNNKKLTENDFDDIDDEYVIVVRIGEVNKEKSNKDLIQKEINKTFINIFVEIGDEDNLKSSKFKGDPNGYRIKIEHYKTIFDKREAEKIRLSEKIYKERVSLTNDILKNIVKNLDLFFENEEKNYVKFDIKSGEDFIEIKTYLENKFDDIFIELGDSYLDNEKWKDDINEKINIEDPFYYEIDINFREPSKEEIKDVIKTWNDLLIQRKKFKEEYDEEYRDDQLYKRLEGIKNEFNEFDGKEVVFLTKKQEEKFPDFPKIYIQDYLKYSILTTVEGFETIKHTKIYDIYENGREVKYKKENLISIEDYTYIKIGNGLYDSEKVKNALVYLINPKIYYKDKESPIVIKGNKLVYLLVPFLPKETTEEKEEEKEEKQYEKERNNLLTERDNEIKREKDLLFNQLQKEDISYSEDTYNKLQKILKDYFEIKNKKDFKKATEIMRKFYKLSEQIKERKGNDLPPHLTSEFIKITENEGDKDFANQQKITRKNLIKQYNTEINKKITEKYKRELEKLKNKYHIKEKESIFNPVLPIRDITKKKPKKKPTNEELYVLYKKETTKNAVRGGKETQIFQKWKAKYLKSNK